MAATGQRAWPFVESASDEGSVFINPHCRLRTSEGYRVVTVRGVVVAHYSVGDRWAEAHAMVSLVEQGSATQLEVAAAFGCSERTVRRHQRRFEDGGLAALGRPRGYPRGRPRLPEARSRLVSRWRAEGKSNREIARRLGVSDKATRKLLGRLGWKAREPEQLVLGVEGADPKLSGIDGDDHGEREEAPAEPADNAPRPAPHSADPKLSGVDGDDHGEREEAPAEPADNAPRPAPHGADPKLSGVESDGQAPAVTFDLDPQDRQTDRMLAALGFLDDAAPLFGTASDLPSVGVLLAIPALVDSGVVDVARDVYGSIGPAFYGLRTTMVTLLLMGLMRIKRPEGLKEHSPGRLGRLLGLDRAPEVKTLRRKLARLAAYGRAAEFGHALAQKRVESRGHAVGFLYVDGHVRAYHGKRDIPKAYVTRRHLAMPATTDYWVNDAEGEPLFVVTCEANKQLATMLPVVLDELRTLIGPDRRATVVFARGGWSPKLFRKLIAARFDILTYRKGKFRRIAQKHFSEHKGSIDGNTVSYILADSEVRLLNQKLRLRQVTRLGSDGHQIGIVTSRRDLPAHEIAYRMSERWRQENFFKYLRTEYALDALVDYGIEQADEGRMVPNPARRDQNAKIRKAYAELNQLAAEYGVEALTNAERVRRTMRGFKIANAPLSNRILELMKGIIKLENQRAKMPTKVPVQRVVDDNVIKLSVERKLLTDLLKMVSYQAECDLLRLVAHQYPRAEDEGRALIRSAMATAGDIEVTDDELRVKLDPLSSPHRTQVLAALCGRLNEAAVRFPGSKLRLRYELKLEPAISLAFPGARPAADPAAEAR